MIESFKDQISKKTDNELSDIFINNNKYQKEFVEFVELELKRRNLPIDSILELRKKNCQINDEFLSIGDKGSPIWIAFGFIGSLVGGIFAVFLGYSYAYSKRKNSLGKDFFVYDESTRKQGRIMFYLGLTIFGLAFLVNIL